jgi:hypothetical protein
MGSMEVEATRALDLLVPSNEQLERYITTLHLARTGTPLCPKCFMGGRSVRMVKARAASDFGAARCIICKTTLDWDATLSA